MAEVITVTKHTTWRKDPLVCGICGRKIKIGEKIGIPANGVYFTRKYWPKCQECCIKLHIY